IWVADLERALSCLAVDDPRWGVLGCRGETLEDNGWGHAYSTGLGIFGKPFERPAQVQNLDEIVLILRKSSGLRFDDTLPHYHMYGADICLRAQEMGMKNYAISAFCIHNTHQIIILPKEFYESYRHLKRTWRKRLPVRTTCMRITRFDVPMLKRRL